MTTAVSYTSKDLKDMLAAATQWLEKSASDIDALNVFPVPDGDTGTNMLLTMRSTLEEIARTPDSRLGSVATAMSHGSLMGARGNSGVILSQILRGLGAVLESKRTFTGRDIAEGLKQSVELAYKSIARPVEGTMLTVVRDVAAAAEQASQAEHDRLLPVLEASVNAARDSVARTPGLLPVLRQACVVDAGGQGLYVLLQGMLLFRRGEIRGRLNEKPDVILPLETCAPTSTSSPAEEEEKPYGYCTELLVQGERLNVEAIRQKLENGGECLIVVGDPSAVKVHIHTYRPGDILNLAIKLGTVHDILIRNMDDQHKEYLQKRRALDERAARSPRHPETSASPAARNNSLPIAVIPVASGEGLTRVFGSLGAATVVPGGATMNPSTQELLEAIAAAPSDKVILLPNDKNIAPAAQQACSLASKQVVVVPTETIPQGIAALLAFSAEADVETNSKAMAQARISVKTVSLTYAVRSTKLLGQRIKQSQSISLVDDTLAGAGNSLAEALEQALLSQGIVVAEAITIYSGKDVPSADQMAVETVLRQRFPSAQIEVVDGGQPYYPFIISIE